MPSIARPARPRDVAGIIRLVEGMYSEMAEEYAGARPPANPTWVRAAETALLERLGDDVMAFVIEHPSIAGDIVAVAVGRLQTTLPSPRRRGTTSGYVEWVTTEPRMRRRGFARAAVAQLLGWFEERDAGVVDLHASSASAPLYREMGFEGGGPISLSRRP
ncbi:GNAT family N-acetyltransferase [Microbacterium sp. A93]|uniref:GNAT family N-acetyltransferase n=1 Tax=Microbacterium sp. A93 TaxID=3450716 RepID=UPI003F433D9B